MSVPSERPADGVAAPAANNTVPELTSIELRAVGVMLARGARRLVSGDPAGRARLSRASDSVFLPWLPVVAVPTMIVGVVAVLAPGLPTVVAGLVGGALSLLALLLAAGVDSTVPPPRRPDCQLDELDGRPHPFWPYFARTGLVEYVPGQVWMAQMPLVFHGLQMATRMTVVRTAPGELLVCSPIELDDELRAAVEALGTVRTVVAPNTIHHMFVGPWLEAWPQARALAAPQLAERRPDLPWAATIDEGWSPPWSRDVVDFVVLRGHSFWVEVALYHRPSRTLVLTDALENVGHAPESTPVLRAFMELFGMAQRPSPPTDLKVTFDDLAAARRSVEAVAAWDFERIIVAHGRLIERDAKATFLDGWAFVYEE